MGMKNVLGVLYTPSGKYVISILLGVGLASLFRKACKDRNCMVFHAPPFEEVTKNVYQHNNKCYTFKDKTIDCASAPQRIGFA